MSPHAAEGNSDRNGFANLLIEFANHAEESSALADDGGAISKRARLDAAPEVAANAGTRTNGRPDQDSPARAAGAAVRRRDEPAQEAGLSYEKALRIHARTNLAGDLDLPEPPMAPGDRDRSAPSAKGAGTDGSRIATSEESGRLQTETVLGEAETSAVAAPDAEVSTAGLEQVRIKPTGSGSERRKGRASNRGLRRLARGKKQIIGLARASAPAAPGATASVKLRPDREDLGGDATSGMIWDPAELRDLAHNGPQPQRRMIVSVRLTAEELEQLRERAEESGISIAAYMRSCVVDAEKLRTQVKQAIAEMRSLGAASLIQRHAALQSSSLETRESGSWLGSLWRSAAAFLNPFSPRRSA